MAAEAGISPEPYVGESTASVLRSALHANAHKAHQFGDDGQPVEAREASEATLKLVQALATLRTAGLD